MKWRHLVIAAALMLCAVAVGIGTRWALMSYQGRGADLMPFFEDVDVPAGVDTTVKQPDNEGDTMRSMLFIGGPGRYDAGQGIEIPGVDHFWHEGMTVYDISSCRTSDGEVHEPALDAVLAENDYGFVVVSIDPGDAEEDVSGAYRSLLEKLVRTQPQAVIAVQGSADPTLDSQIHSVAQEMKVCYLEAYTGFDPEAAVYRYWAEWIYEEMKKLDT